MNYQEMLNEKQYEAVVTDFQHVRIVAGAGSGKTRVLTYRIAYLIGEEHVLPWKILAFTFTNKVAAEMRDRVFNLVPNECKNLSIRTFHSFAAYFLRQEIHAINFPSTFTILDEEDQTTLLKEICVGMGYRKKDPIVKQAIDYIGKMKLREKYPDDISIGSEHHSNEKECLEIYKQYEEQKNKMYCLDFDDLLLQTNRILEENIDIRLKWQTKFDHILIDEFQDTNDIEFKMVKYLKNPMCSLYVVGDPDQTIYTWRGANQDIILKLETNYPDIKTIILNRNYRSTQNILDCANKLIAHNRMRIKKDLYTENENGDKIIVTSKQSTISEAEYVGKEIQRLILSTRYQYKDIAILYRSNYVTLDFERVLTQLQIPYVIYGGMKFYERKEVKDVLAYFHLITNPKDNISFLRIINTPRRGIGDTSIELIKNEAKDGSIYDYIRNVDVDNSNVPSKVLFSLKTMIENIELTKIELKKNEEVYSKTLENMIISIGYLSYLEKEDDGDDRIENVKTIFEDIRHFLKNNPESTFDEYLQNIALLSSQDEINDTHDKVTLMTAHTAKGLEFPVVFVVRFNENVFPSVRSLLDNGFKALEEERRLAYVAMTRAKEKLYLTYTLGYSYVVNGQLTPSRFLKESGNEVVINEPNYNAYKSTTRRSEFKFIDEPSKTFVSDEPIRQDFSQETNGITNWNIGDIVNHKTLGRGTVIGLEGDDIITVEFENHGKKSIMGNHPFVKKEIN